MNTGEGACFPMHFDTAAGVVKDEFTGESLQPRQLTMILYLNEDWKDEHGKKDLLHQYIIVMLLNHSYPTEYTILILYNIYRRQSSYIPISLCSPRYTPDK